MVATMSRQNVPGRDGQTLPARLYGVQRGEPRDSLGEHSRRLARDVATPPALAKATGASRVISSHVPMATSGIDTPKPGSGRSR